MSADGYSAMIRSRTNTRLSHNMENHYRPVSQWLAAAPATPVLRHEGRIITIAGLTQQVSRLCHPLIRHPAKACILCFQDSAHFIVALLAVLHAGKTPVLPGNHDPAQCLALTDSNTLLLTDGTLPPFSDGWFTPSYQDESVAVQPLPAIPADSYLSLYTSGSGGTPKRVDKSLAVMDTEARWLASLWENTFNARCVRGSVSHQHLYGLTFCLWLPLSLGYLTDTTTVKFPEQLAYPEPYIFITSPAFLQFLDHNLAPPVWSFIISAGGKLEWALADATLRWGAVAVNEIYGSTETGVVAHRERRSGDSAWQLFDGATLSAADDESYYYLHSALLAPQTHFLLEDKLQLTDDGGFILAGRTDKIIKIGEKRISVTAIENRLIEHPAVADVAVVPVSRRGRTYLGAVVVVCAGTKTPGAAQFAQWRAFLRHHTDPVAVPRFWRVVPVIPLNPQSKRSWSVLQELFNVTG